VAIIGSPDRDGYSRNMSLNRRRRNDPARRIQDFVVALPQAGGFGFTEDEMAALKPEDAAWMPEEVATSVLALGHFRRRLLAVAEPAVGARVCEQCRSSIYGRADAVYCSRACRQRAYRARCGGSAATA